MDDAEVIAVLNRILSTYMAANSTNVTFVKGEFKGAYNLECMALKRGIECVEEVSKTIEYERPKQYLEDLSNDII